MIICDNDLGMSTFYNILILFLKKTAEAHLFVNLMHTDLHDYNLS